MAVGERKYPIKPILPILRLTKKFYKDPINTMDPFRICLALGPLAVYLLSISLINLRRQPTLLSGTSDTAAIGLGVIGLMMIGPMELFMPDAAAARFGSYAWLFMIGLYGMVLVLSLLTLRPRLVIYNISSDELRAVLGDTVERLEPEARWAGDCLSMPKLGIQLYLDATPAMRNVTLVAGGQLQSPSGWKRLEVELAPIAENDPRRLQLPCYRPAGCRPALGHDRHGCRHHTPRPNPRKCGPDVYDLKRFSVFGFQCSVRIRKTAAAPMTAR